MRFNPGWKMSLFALPLLPIMVSLGFWQLDRADEKREILAQQQALLAQAPVRITSAAADNYQPLTLIGEYDTQRHFLLDNVVYNGVVGYDVITPFFDISGYVVLVNRGWLASTGSRDELPLVETPAGRVILAGNAGRNLQAPFLLAEQAFADQWPQVVQAVDVDKMAAVLAQPLENYFVRLDMASSGAYQSHYKVINIQPSKHTGYAAQWFAMSLALLILYLMFGFGKFKSTVKAE